MYDCIKDAYGVSRNAIASVAKQFVIEELEVTLGRNVQKNRHRKVTGDVNAHICAIASFDSPGAPHAGPCRPLRTR